MENFILTRVDRVEAMPFLLLSRTMDQIHFSNDDDDRIFNNSLTLYASEQLSRS